jgi:O-antigen/teichoic acid export membrane protein
MLYGHVRFNRSAVFHLSEILNFSIPQGIADSIGYLYQSVLLFLVGYYTTSSNVGLIGAALKLTNIGGVFLIGFTLVFAPIISDYHQKKDMNKLGAIFKIINYWIFAMSLPFFLLLIFKPGLIMMLYGKSFIRGASMLILLSIGQLVNNVTGSVGTIIAMSGWTKLSLINNLIAVFVVIGLSLVLIPPFGALGGAAAFALSMCIVNIIRSIEVNKLLGINGFSARLIKPAVAATVSMAILLLIPDNLNINIFLRVGITLIIFSLLYVFLIWKLGVNYEDRILIDSLQNRLTGKFSTQRIYDKS